MAKKRRRKKPRHGRPKAKRGPAEAASDVPDADDDASRRDMADDTPADDDEASDGESGVAEAPNDDADEAEEVRRPHAAAAALLSLVVPGAGQVYAGRRTRGVLWWAVPSAVVLLCAALARVLGPWPLLLAMLGAGVVPRILAPADAYLMAKRPDAAAPAGLIVILGLMGLFAGNRGVANLIDRYFFASFGVLTHAMTPSLLPGDQLFVDRRAFDEDTPPAPGDVVLVGDAEQARVLRVVARKGDTVAWREGHLIVNDTPVKRCPAGTIRIGEEDRPVHVVWLQERAFLQVDDGQTTEPVPVEAELALLGDGLVVPAIPGATVPDLPRFEQRPASQVRGRPWTIFWSTAPPGDESAHRMDRVALRLDGERPVTTALPADLLAGIETCLRP